MAPTSTRWLRSAHWPATPPSHPRRRVRTHPLRRLASTAPTTLPNPRPTTIPRPSPTSPHPPCGSGHTPTSRVCPSATPPSTTSPYPPRPLPPPASSRHHHPTSPHPLACRHHRHLHRAATSAARTCTPSRARRARRTGTGIAAVAANGMRSDGAVPGRARLRTTHPFVVRPKSPTRSWARRGHRLQLSCPPSLSV